MDLLRAAECGRLSVVKKIVSTDSALLHSVQHKDASNRAFNVNGAPIHYACRSGHWNVVKYLLNQDSTLINQVDVEDWTPLHYACYNGHLNIVKLLVEYHPNVDAKDSCLSQTPIQFAMYREFEGIARFLDTDGKWERTWKHRNTEEIARQGNTPVFRRGSHLFLGRYTLTDEHVNIIEAFREDLNHEDIILKNVLDVELDQLKVCLLITHNFDRHLKKTAELMSSTLDEDDRFLRSSTTCTNEHILVLNDT